MEERDKVKKILDGLTRYAEEREKKRREEEREKRFEGPSSFSWRPKGYEDDDFVENVGIEYDERYGDVLEITDTDGKRLSSGTTVYDLSRHSNNLTCSVSLESLSEKTGWVFNPYYTSESVHVNLNGTSEYFYCANDTDFDFGNATTDSAFSIVCCLNPDAVDSRFIIGKWDENNAREWCLFLNASGYPTFQLYDESADAYIGRVDSASFGTGTWKVLIATYDGSGISAGCKIYVDGVQVDDADYASGTYVAMEAVSANLMVGAKKNNTTYSEYYDGKMTWIGIAAKELSADEVWSLTQRLKGVLGV